MKLAQNPMGKFTIARSLYKSILRYVSSNHGRKYTVQPLPPNHFSVEVNALGVATLSWSPQTDKQEPSAIPSSYLLYIRGGFDNGQMVKTAACQVKLEPGKLYRFKVTAFNKGGESFPSETLSALYNPNAKKTVLVVNNFHRLASPQVIDNATEQGFDLDADPGVSYGLTAGWKVFNKSRMGDESENGLGYCGNEMIGQFVAGNDFNYTCEHASAIAATQKYNIASCSSEAIISGKIDMKHYTVVDLINGLERYDGYPPEYYKSFSPSLMNRLQNYAVQGGRLFVSGSYLGSDMQTTEEKAFLANTLKVAYAPNESIAPTADVEGLGLKFNYYNTLNETHYAATHPEILLPATDHAICAMQYESGASAAVAFKSGNGSTFTMGFPFECIKDERLRSQLMAGILKYLTEE